MMVTLLLHACSKGITSRRKIEAACVDGVAFRAIAVNRKPDRATIARFRQDKEAEFKELFVEVLRLSAEAGLARVGRVALDGTKLERSASPADNRTAKHFDKGAANIVAEARAIDAREDVRFG